MLFRSIGYMGHMQLTFCDVNRPMPDGQYPALRRLGTRNIGLDSLGWRTGNLVSHLPCHYFFLYLPPPFRLFLFGDISLH